ncbi:MAG: Tetratricopeptide repeat protein [Acidobacteriaceae bacterium]|nr:Tetratricopeptide repeat protein [Acidobacteriaceae bacterium]
MKTKYLAGFLAIMLVSLVAMPAAAQTGYCKVKGKVSDQAGKPIPDAVVNLVNSVNGAKYHLKTDNKGEYYSIGITPGVYEVTFSKDGKPLFSIHQYNMSLQKEDSLNVLDLNLAKEAADAKASGQAKMTEEQKKEAEKIEKENSTIKGLNEMLAQARTAQQSGNIDEAVGIMTKATQMDPSRDLLWGRLAELQLITARKDTDAASRTEKYTQAATSYKKAIELASTSTTPATKALVGPYNNNLGEALAKTGKVEEAIAAYNTATQVDPANAGSYYFNLGATLTNANKPDEAIAAYDKAIAASPEKPEPYYYKGIALLGKATFKGDKMVPVPGTTEAFNKYLELAPDGPLAEPAKQMLTSVGATVTTSIGGKKKTK